jgi:hydroxyacylglutathione hydrolase
MAADARTVVTDYFAALARRDLEAAGACWAPDGVDELIGQATAHGPEGVRAFFGGLFAAIPDFAMAVEGVIAEDDRVSVLWRASGTFAGESPYQGITPTGARVELRGLDFFTVRDGLIAANVAFPDGLGFARQIGLLPEPGTGAEANLTRAFNAKTRALRRFSGGAAEPVADGVWRVIGGVPRRMNVYLLEDEGGGVTVFDAGIKGMGPAIARAATALGGLNRIVLGHSHVDHRGAAPELRAPVFCHADDRAQAEGDGGLGYVTYEQLRAYARPFYRRILRVWDGGPVQIAGTVAEGEDVSGFRVVHIPGHSPGMIALYRERDGLVLGSDLVYTLDVQTGRPSAPQLPLDAFNLDTDQARASARKVAELRPSALWTGHAEPVTGDVAAQLAKV